MMTFVWIVIGLIVLGFILLWVNAIRGSGKVQQELNRKVEPALRAVEENSPLAGELLLQAASQPETRNYLYQSLKAQGKAELFPAEFRTVEKVAESDLTGWLMHPNELAAAPAEIELVSKVVVQEDAKTGYSFLFRFRSAPDHWAAERGWMAGTTGPYWEGEAEIGADAQAFSELVPFEQMTEAQHVEFLKAAMNKKGLVVPS